MALCLLLLLKLLLLRASSYARFSLLSHLCSHSAPALLTHAAIVIDSIAENLLNTADLQNAYKRRLKVATSAAAAPTNQRAIATAIALQIGYIFCI